MAGLRLPEHSHCAFCGDPIPFGEEFCDDECRRGEERRISDENRKEMLFFVGAGLSVVVIVALGFIL
ncbi:MAG: DUF2116 family Zn-ribbon domain-containing protein [Candidatus Methanomethylophilaceae archaeon]|nr:DUF2116 family Zn-ribbon domain-containing protein [Candidatus Methanomethylophilaceae archaeon]